MLAQTFWVLPPGRNVGLFAPRCFGRKRFPAGWAFGLGFLLSKPLPNLPFLPKWRNLQSEAYKFEIIF